MGHRAIELHDSEVTAIRRVGPDVVLNLSAYIQSSDGVPGVDPGTGWSQEAELVVTAGIVAGEPQGGTLWVTDGSIKVGGVLHNNMVPLPFNQVGIASVQLEGAEGKLAISGTGVEIILKGTPTYVEKFR